MFLCNKVFLLSRERIVPGERIQLSLLKKKTTKTKEYLPNKNPLYLDRNMISSPCYNKIAVDIKYYCIQILYNITTGQILLHNI